MTSRRKLEEDAFVARKMEEVKQEQDRVEAEVNTYNENQTWQDCQEAERAYAMFKPQKIVSKRDWWTVYRHPDGKRVLGIFPIYFHALDVEHCVRVDEIRLYRCKLNNKDCARAERRYEACPVCNLARCPLKER